MFARYAAIVKNLRGVVYIEETDEETLWLLNWLLDRFKYRDIGVSNIVFNRIPKEIRGKLLRLDYPIQRYYNLVNKLIDVIEIEDGLVETLLTSSIYISPTLYIGIGESIKSLERYSVGVVKTSKSMDKSGWRLHLRIADYSILDLYRDMVDYAYNIIRELKLGSPPNLEKMREIRRRIAEKDSKRYWRIMDADGQHTFLLYIDLLDLVLDNLNRCGWCIELEEEDSAALTIVPVVHISKSLIS